MPNYVYRGTDCPHEFEVYQSFSDDPLTECSECGKPVRRVFQPTGLVFKGSGWYINDSRKKDAGSTSKPSSETTEKPAAASSSAPASTAPASTESSKKAEPAAAASSGKKD